MNENLKENEINKINEENEDIHTQLIVRAYFEEWQWNIQYK